MTNVLVPPDGIFLPGLNQYITGVGQFINNIHDAALCEGRACVIHNPSDHQLRGFKTNWRHGGLFDIKPPHMERMCSHGVGHPDPDDAAYWAGRGENVGVHGCDGCCRNIPLVYDSTVNRVTNIIETCWQDWVNDVDNPNGGNVPPRGFLEMIAKFVIEASV